MAVIIYLLEIFLSRPRFLLPPGVQLSELFLRTWPTHLHLLVASMLFVVLCPIILSSWLFEIFLWPEYSHDVSKAFRVEGRKVSEFCQTPAF